VTLAIAVAAIWGIAVAGLGAWLTDLTPWYRTLRKPSWQPSDWLFGPAWTTILALASISLWLFWTEAPSDARRAVALTLFVANGALNLAWSPLFFRLRRPDLALMEVPFLWLSILAPMLLLGPIGATPSLLLLPYLGWVTFAAFLNWTIVKLNGPFPARAVAKAPIAPDR